MSEPTRNILPIPVVLSTNKCTRSGLPIPVTITGGTGVVNSVNGQTGDAVLDGNNIYSDASEAEPVTLNDALAGEAQDRQDADSDLQTKINALAGLGGALPHKDFGASPAAGQPLPEVWQETLTEYACQSIWGNGGTFAWNSAEPWNSTYAIDEVTHTAVEIFNSTWVRNDNDNHKFVLTNTPNSSPQIFDWADVGIDAVAQFTDTLAGVIKGDSTTFAAVKSKTDGTGSVNGLTNTGDGTKALMDNGSYDYTENYSENEVRCGTWIDGKPIYKKTYTTSFTSSSTIQYPAIDATFRTDGKRLVRLEGIALRNNDTLRRWIPAYWNTGAGIEAFMYDCSNSDGLYLCVLTETGAFTWVVYTTAYYTKTTD